jgi:cytochrome c oxidase subunit II
MPKGEVLLIAFAAAAAVAVIFMVSIAISTLRREPLEVAKDGRVVRGISFTTLLAAVVAAFIISIHWFPYPTASQSASFPHFSVVAQQYSFRMPPQLPLHKHIILDVSSRDVNHGAGIYDPAGALIGQVQAMPGYVNHLPFYFATPGRYTLRCMEYCGAGHPAMLGLFKVR